MSMADEHTLRPNRSNDPLRRAGEQAGSSDPLSELARLIGQSDPFADFSHGSPRSTERVASAPSGGYDWRRAAAAMPPYEAERQEPAPEERMASTNPRYPGHDREEFLFNGEPPAPAHAGYSVHAGYGQSGYGQSGYDETPYEENRGSAHARPEARFPPAQHRDELETAEVHQDEPIYTSGRPDIRLSEPYYDAGAPLTPEDEASYDDAPRNRTRSRSGLITAVTLIACAMVGTAGAYGYRTYYGGPPSPRTPPVITAEGTPSKIMPTPDGQPGKTIQDRVGDQGSPERVMPGAEQPIELRSPVGSTNPRVVLPPPVQPNTSPFPSPAETLPPPSTIPPQGTGTAPPAPGGEPKRVRTVTIRNDGGAGNAPRASAQTPPASRPAPKARSAPAPRNSGPLSLDPDDQTAELPAPSRERTAALPLTQTTPRTPPGTAFDLTPSGTTASPGGNGGRGGSYMVQLSSQRSEAEARSAYHSMQTRFPNQLRGRTPVVRRAELGAKGTYYRAMVGPFASSGEAERLCSSLKSAGGTCIVQRN